MGEFWNKNHNMNSQKVIDHRRYQSTAHNKTQIYKDSFNIGVNQKSQVIDTTNNESFKNVRAVSNDIREKDKQVYEFMKRKNVHFGSMKNEQPGSSAQTSFPMYHKNEISNVNGELPVNSNFKRSVYISGSPAREHLDLSASNDYESRSPSQNTNLNDNGLTSKQLKQELLSHKFNFGYGKDTHKKEPGMDLTQHTKENIKNLNDCKVLKKKIEKQNFKYSEDISPSTTSNDIVSVYGSASDSRYLNTTYQKTKPPMDYWKTNFKFNQLSESSNTNPHEGINGYTNSLKSSKNDFNDIKSNNAKQNTNLNAHLLKNKTNALKSNFHVGYNKDTFQSSYNNQFTWKVPKNNMT